VAGTAAGAAGGVLFSDFFAASWLSSGVIGLFWEGVAGLALFWPVGLAGLASRGGCAGLGVVDVVGGGGVVVPFDEPFEVLCAIALVPIASVAAIMHVLITKSLAIAASYSLRFHLQPALTDCGRSLLLPIPPNRTGHPRSVRLVPRLQGRRRTNLEIKARTNMHGRIRIRMEAYDHQVLDASAKEIVEQAKISGARVAGPVPLPTRRETYTVNRSPFIDKKSREQFEIRTHKRIIDITEPNARTIDALNRLVVPAGVFVKIKA
jgi:small subunit ribosomal protein S10